KKNIRERRSDDNVLPRVGGSPWSVPSARSRTQETRFRARQEIRRRPGLDCAEQHFPFIDKNRECVLGGSYGGYMANWILGHTDRFKCIVSHDGMLNPEPAYGQ